MKLFPLLLIVYVAGAAAACLPVTGDRILASDLARANPEFAGLPATLPVAFTPAPGVSRTFRAAELQRFARANGMTLTSPAEPCFEMPMHKVDESEFLEAMRRSMASPASLNIIEMGRSPIPAGRIEFPLTSLEPAPAGGEAPRLWRGFVQYTATRRVAVWARVAVVESRPVARRGDTVPVEVHSGAAVLRFDAIAENTIRDGSIANLRNPVTGKTFHARVDGAKAIVVVGRGPAL